MVSINPPIDKTGYIKLGDSVLVASNITNKFKTAFKLPAKTGKYQERFKINFVLFFFWVKHRIHAVTAESPVAKNIIQFPYCPSKCNCCVFCTIKQHAFPTKMIKTSNSHFAEKGCFSCFPVYKQRLNATTTNAIASPTIRVNSAPQKQKPHTVVPISDNCKISEVNATEPTFKA